MVNAMKMYKKHYVAWGWFPIHNEKSLLIPSQVLTFLGFVLNSVTMTEQLTASTLLAKKPAQFKMWQR